MSRAAAFFDLDRTLIRRSSALALAGAFRARGLIGRKALAKAAIWQIVFTARGASAEGLRRAAEDGMRPLAGFSPVAMRTLVAEAMDGVLRPLVFREALELARAHQAAGEPVFIVSATLQEIVEALAEELGLDGALGSTCEIADGLYTGRALRSCHGRAKAEALAALAEREEIDLARSAAYSDSHTDLPLLEAVGRPFAVNADRELRQIAGERGWPVLEFREPLGPASRRGLRPLLYGLPLVLGAGVAVWARRRAA